MKNHPIFNTYEEAKKYCLEKISNPAEQISYIELTIQEKIPLIHDILGVRRAIPPGNRFGEDLFKLRLTIEEELKNLKLSGLDNEKRPEQEIKNEQNKPAVKTPDPLKWKKSTALLADFFDYLFENEYLEKGDQGEKWALLEGRFKDKQGKIITADRFKSANSEVTTKGKNASAKGKEKLIEKLIESEKKRP